MTSSPNRRDRKNCAYGRLHLQLTHYKNRMCAQAIGMRKNETGAPYAVTGRISKALLAGTLIFFLTTPARALEKALPTRHVRDAVTEGQAVFLQRMDANRRLQLSVVLSLHDQSGLNALIQQIYDPQSPSYRRFLSVQEFAGRFGPSQRDYNAVAAFCRANGFTVKSIAANRLVLDVEAPVARIENAFHLTMGVYRHPSENRTFYAADREPTVNLDVPLWHIAGLDNFSIPHPASLKRDSAPHNAGGSGPHGYFIGSDFRAAYYGGSALTGAGQSVGLLEFAGFNMADVTNYFSKVGQPLNVPVKGISTDGSSLKCIRKCDDSEQVLDIEVAISMAPGMRQVLVYVSKKSDVSIFGRMASDNIAKSLSCSWGWNPADTSSDDPIFQEFAAQGQTLFVASGDDGAYHTNPRYVYPADNAYITSVGGTDLITNGAGGPWKSETSWVDSGGGISPNQIPIPSYQAAPGVITPASRGSLTYRNAPDVAAEGNTDNYICYDLKCNGGWGGTSFAAPRWAGYIALANERAVSQGGPTVGFLNPAIYPIGLSGAYGLNFHDIAGDGTSFHCLPSMGLAPYPVLTGFDLVTGWGSPNGSALIDTLTQ
jgi:subtilase family serine protease